MAVNQAPAHTESAAHGVPGTSAHVERGRGVLRARLVRVGVRIRAGSGNRDEEERTKETYVSAEGRG